MVDNESKVVGERLDREVRSNPGQRLVIVVLGEDEADVVLTLDTEILSKREGKKGQ